MNFPDMLSTISLPEKIPYWRLKAYLIAQNSGNIRIVSPYWKQEGRQKKKNLRAGASMSAYSFPKKLRKKETIY